MKRNELLHPSKGILWVEGGDMRGENEGSWAMNVGTAANNFSIALRGDSPAAFHVTSANFSFADAHAESYKWLDGTNIAFANDSTPAKDAGGTSRTAAQHAGNVYAIWVASHYPGGQNPRWHINFCKPGANRMNLAWFSKQQKWLLRL